jgi:hypothetical protein
MRFVTAHVVPRAVGGEATIANMQLRCRAHNGYEADVFFGTDRSNRGADGVARRSEKSAVSWTFSPVPERSGDSSAVNKVPGSRDYAFISAAACAASQSAISASTSDRSCLRSSTAFSAAARSS